MSNSPTPTPPTPKASTIGGKTTRLIEISHAVHNVRREQAEKALQDAMAAEAVGADVADDDPAQAKCDDHKDGWCHESEPPAPSPQPPKEKTTIASFVFGSDWAEKVVRGDYPEPTTPVRHDPDNEHLHTLPRKGKDAALPGRKRARVISEGTINEDVNERERGRTDYPPPYQAPSPLEQGIQATPRQTWQTPYPTDAAAGYANAGMGILAPPADLAPTRDRALGMSPANQMMHGQYAHNLQTGPRHLHVRPLGPTPQMPLAPQASNEAHAISTLAPDPLPHAPCAPQVGAVRSDHVVISADLYDALVRRHTAMPLTNTWPVPQDAQEAFARPNDLREHAPYRAQNTVDDHWTTTPPAPQALPQGLSRLGPSHPAHDARADGMDIDYTFPLSVSVAPGLPPIREEAPPIAAQIQQARTTVNLLIETGQILCTPRPYGGFPIPEGRGPFDALRHASASRLAAWKTFPPARRFLFDIVGKLSFTESEATDITSYVEGRLYQITGERGAVLLPPEPRRPDVPKEDGPSAWMACGYSEQATAIIVEHGVLSYDHNNTFIIYSGSHPPPTYILTLEGFTQKKEEPVIAAIREVLAKEDVLKETARIADANPRCPGIDPMAVATTLPRSLRVEMVRLKNNKVVAHVYLEPPTRDPLSWDAWRNLLRAQEYKHILLPDTVRVRALQRCFACHAADHEVDACTLPHVLGWRGPTLQDLVIRAETEPMPTADHNPRINIAQPTPRWPQPGVMRGAMHAGPSSGVPRSQRNPNRSYGRN